METYESGQLVYTLTTGAGGSAQTASDLLPYGTYVAVEVSSPTGYLSMQKSYLSDSEAVALGLTYSASQDIYYDEASETSYFYDTKEQAFYCYTAYTTQSVNRLHVSYYGSYESKFEIREAGETVDLTGEEGSIYDLVKRGDFSIYKVDDETQQPMEGVQFKITSVTTGESHIVTTDANGYYSSAQTAHSSADGLWFGLDAGGNSVPVDDSLGALPYDTYYIEELEGEANEGMIMWSGYIYVTADTVYENGYVINLDINNRRPIISTSASNEETGNKYLAASEGAVVEDAITYKNLEAGTYLLRSVLMDRDTKKVIVDAQGKEAISETTVKLISSEGSTTAEITLDASSLSGVNVVVFEYFYTVAEDGTETLVYSHTDFEDQEQYVYFAGIGTTATDNDTEDHVACADEEITLVDVVEYTNLPANRIFTVTGTLMLKSTGEEYLDDNGNTVTAEATFTSSETGSGITYAVHADIIDEDETVEFPKIGTKADDAETGLSEGLAEGTVSIKDTVSYSGLTAGKTYTLTGTLMDQSTGKALTDSEGNAYTASTEFTAEESDGSTVVTFTVPGTALLGKTVVVFENLYYEGKQIAIHADIKDKGQTVDYPKIGTTATDAETGLHGNYADEDTEMTIIDTVEYTNLTPNTLHTMTGTLMDKSTGEELTDSEGNTYTATTTFTSSETGSGTVEMTFTVPGSVLKGKTVVVFEDLYYEGEEVAVHADIDDEGQTVTYPEPEIGTTAKDAETGLHEGYADEEVTIIDTVAYEGLVPNAEHTMTGTLMDKSTGEELTDSEGNTYTATTTFISSASGSGTVEMTFTVPGSIVSGKTVVVFESAGFEDGEIAVHADIDDEDQSVSYPEVGTSARDQADGDSQITANGTVTIIDTVTYTALTPGNPYRVSGVLMDAETEKSVKVDGEEVTAETTFTAEEADGTVEVEFTFDASDLTHDVVVFEKLYTVDTETGDEALVASHEDIEDEAQTITVKVPTATATTTKTTTTAKTGSSPKTGVEDRRWLLLCLVAASGVFLLCSRKRKKEMK
ncbi:MAG: VaFE repeat-containing surface-anchored protein [Lachnospiraceae bacterium]|nr:VaFE repeat-containing surface-anchored protein [Lachnospiraceae bacterium]